VPLQGHWNRVNTPLRETTGRERWLVRIVAGVLGIGVVAAVVVAMTTSGGGTDSGCVRVDVPSTMGGSTIHACGAQGAAFCRGPVAHDPSLRATALPRCREAGYSTTPG